MAIAQQGDQARAGQRPERIRFSFIEYLTFALLALSIVYQLFTDPIVGLASNGDYWRITEPVGLQYTEPPEVENAYLQTTYEFGESDDWAGYRSSELLIVHTALTVNRVVSKDQLFDIRVLGAVHTTLYLLGAGVLLTAIRRFGITSRIVGSALLLPIFSDVAYVSYFNSFYSEPASLIFLMLTAGFALMLVTREPGERWSLAWLVLFFLASTLLITAKPQNGPLAIPLALIGYRLSGLPLRPDPEQIKRQISGLALAGMVIVVGLVNPFVAHPDGFREANLYNVVFAEILGNSEDPEGDLRAMGLDPALSEYAGTHAYATSAPVQEQVFHDRFYNQIGYGGIALFYLQHPGQTIDLLSRGAESSMTMRPDYLGNFRESAGQPPQARSQAFAIWSNRKPLIFPNSLAFLSAFAAASLTFSVLVHRRFRESRTLQRTAEFSATLVIMAGMQFLLVLFGEGEFEIVKHLFLFQGLFDMSLVMLGLLLSGAGSLLVHQTDWNQLKGRLPWNR